MNRRKLHAMYRKLPMGVVLLLPILIVSLAVLVSLRASESAVRAHIMAAAALHNVTRRVTLERDVRALVPGCAQGAGRAKSFVLLFMGHSGSTALISALKQHDEVLVSGFEPLDHGAMARDTSRALEYARNFFSAGAVGNRTAGFKVRPHHILQNPKAWADLFREHGTRVIWNYRSNIFKQAVGHYPILYLNDTAAYEGLRVERSAKTHKRRRRVRSFPIHNSAAFHRLLSARWRGERQVEDALAALGHDTCVLPVSYELLLRAPTKALLAMQAFLGLRLDSSIRALRAKATSDNLCEVVTNWHEVCRDFFLCARWRAMMDDAGNGCTCPVPTGMAPARARQFCEPTERSAPPLTAAKPRSR